MLTFVMYITNQFWPTTHNRKLWSQLTLDGLTVDKMENPLQYVAMIKWRAGPPEHFQFFLEYC